MYIKLTNITQLIISNAILIVLYFLGYYLSSNLAISPHHLIIIFISVGIGLFALLIFGERLLAGIIMGAFISNLYAAQSYHTDFLVTTRVILYTFGATISIWVAYRLIGYFLDIQDLFKNVDSILKFLLIIFISFSFSATVGISTLYFSNLISVPFFLAWCTWFLGDISGIILVTSTLWLIFNEIKEGNNWSIGKFLEFIILISSIIVVGVWIADNPYPVFFVFLPFLLWAALRFYQIGTAFINLIVSGTFVWMAHQQAGFFKPLSVSETFFLLQGFIMVTSTTSLMLATIVKNQKKAEWNLQKANQELEKRVLERTFELNEQKNQLLAKHQEINAQKEDLRKLNKVKDTLFSIISHDLRSPLTTLKGFLSLLDDESEQEDTSFQNQKILSTLKQRLDISLDLLDNLLYWASSQMNNLKPEKSLFDLKQVIEDVFQLFQISAQQKNITLFFPSTESVTLLADINMIKSILRNLISNAIKFTPHNGRIQVEVTKENDFIKVAISDNGIGMTLEQQKKLFNQSEHQSTLGTNQEKGTGLGLLLCKEFVELHHGKIGFQSVPKEGSTFYFTLPISQ